MQDLTLGAIAAGVVTSALLVSANYLMRGWAWPVIKSRIEDVPKFAGEWLTNIDGAGNEVFRLYLNISHYSPYVRGQLDIEKEKDKRSVSQSSLRLTGFICDTHVSLAGRTAIKERRSISTLILEINATSQRLAGTYCFRCLELRTIRVVPVEFERVQKA